MLTIQQSSTFNAYKISTMEVNFTSSLLQLAERAIQLLQTLLLKILYCTIQEWKTGKSILSEHSLIKKN